MVESTQEVKTAEEMGGAPETVSTTTETQATATTETAAETTTVETTTTETGAENNGTAQDAGATEKPRESFFEKNPTETATAVIEPSAREKELEAELGRYKEQVKKFDESTVGKLAKLETGEYDLTKVDLKKLAKEMAGEDFTKYGLQDLLKMDIQKQYPHLSEEDATAAAEVELGKLEEWQKKALPTTLAAKLSASHKPHEILERLEAVKADQIQATSKYTQQDRDNELTTATKEITDSITALAEPHMGEVVEGIKLTPEVVEKMNQAFIDHVTNYDSQKHFMALFREVTSGEKDATSHAKGFQEGLAEGLKQKTHANAHTEQSGVIVSKESEAGIKPQGGKKQFANVK